MLRFAVRTFAVIGVLFVLLISLTIILMLSYRTPRPSVPDSAVLKVDLAQAYSELGRNDPISRFRGESSAGFIDLLSALNTAASDPRVKGLIANVDGVPYSLAKVQELRDAIAKFRASGKFAYAYGQSLPGNKDIYLASAFEQISVQPLGGLALTGLSAERLFLRGTLDKIGIEPEIERRRDYKTANDAYVYSGYTSSEREMILSYVGSLSGQIIEGIAKGRSMSVEDVRSLIDRGPFTTEEALKSKLIDRIAYADEIRDSALQKASGDKPGSAKVMTMGHYAQAVQDKPKSNATKIALITANGVIMSGQGGDDPVSGTRLGADALAKAITKAVEDKDVKGFLVRADSPGGSALASEVIRHALVKAKKAGKPVVVSMSGVAASGGYWLAMSADAIVAEPATITGSIGVFAMKANIEKLAADWGAGFDRILFGANAGIYSIGKPYTPAERERVSAMVDEIYNSFKSGVAEGRNMTVEAVEKIAQGRVWSGAQAKDLGLVDALGGLDVAQNILREKLKLAADAPLDLIAFPKPPTFIEALAKNLDGGDNGAHSSLMMPAEIQTQLQALQMPRVARMAESYLREVDLALSGEPLALIDTPTDFR